MIPKDTYSNLYLRIYQAEIEKANQTVRGSGPDCPAALGGLSAGMARIVRAGVPNRPRTSRTVRGGVADCPRVSRAGGSQTVSR
jgi:hypothetical protein